MPHIVFVAIVALLVIATTSVVLPAPGRLLRVHMNHMNLDGSLGEKTEISAEDIRRIYLRGSKQEAFQADAGKKIFILPLEDLEVQKFAWEVLHVPVPIFSDIVASDPSYVPVVSRKELIEKVSRTADSVGFLCMRNLLMNDGGRLYFGTIVM